MTTEEVQKKAEDIKERNRRVEGDKAWEVSWTRRIFIAAVTYATAGIWLTTISDTNPWLKALIPMVGYLFSTFSLPPLKRWWLTKQKQQNSFSNSRELENRHSLSRTTRRVRI